MCGTCYKYIGICTRVIASKEIFVHRSATQILSNTKFISLSIYFCSQTCRREQILFPQNVGRIKNVNDRTTNERSNKKKTVNLAYPYSKNGCENENGVRHKV